MKRYLKDFCVPQTFNLYTFDRYPLWRKILGLIILLVCPPLNLKKGINCFFFDHSFLWAKSNEKTPLKHQSLTCQYCDYWIKFYF